MMEIMNAGLRMPVDQTIGLLQNLISEISQTKSKRVNKKRLMVCGAPLNSVDFMSAVEDLGAIVVLDELRMGSRQWIGLVAEDNTGYPLDYIVNRYLGKLPEATFSPYEARQNSLLALAEELKVDGMIYNTIRHCIPHTYTSPITKRIFEAKGIPVLELETEYSMQITGQAITRVEAFLEMIG